MVNVTAAPWNREENVLVVDEYLTMLEQQLAGQDFVKARVNERVRAVTGRSQRSVDSKFMNISAVLLERQIPPVRGFKPYRHYQAALVEVVDESLKLRPRLRELLTESATRVAAPRTDFVWNVTDAPTTGLFPGGPSEPTPLHVDFMALEAANRRLGLQGEALIVQREQEQLRCAGREDLASRVRHLSVLEGDGHGYDIESWTPEGRPRHIEVKTTRAGIDWPMIVTRNEVRVSRERSESYVLARIFNFSARRVGLYELPGAIEDTCSLRPDTWLALPRSSAGPQQFAG